MHHSTDGMYQNFGDYDEYDQADRGRFGPSPSTAAIAAQGMDCCKEMKSCCCKKDGEKPGCCEKMKREKQDVPRDGHADHDMSPEPKN